MVVSDIVEMLAPPLITLETASTANKDSIWLMVTPAPLLLTLLDALFTELTHQPQFADHVPVAIYWLETDVSNQSPTVFNTSRELTFVPNAPLDTPKPLTGAVVLLETSPHVSNMIV
jgi:hypothetical protein